jgi:lipopolysaccharide transport system permease protein
LSPLNRVVIEPKSGWVPIDLREFWSYRELAWALAMREVLVRYKQSVLGAAWAVLQPTLTMVVFTLLFGTLFGKGNLPTADGVPYAVSTYCALLPWQLFAQAVTRASQSIVSNQNLITKIYFPRLIIPLAPVIAALVDFAVAFVVLVALMIWYGIMPGPQVVCLPLLVLFAVLSALAFSVWLAAVNAIYRDVQYVVPFLVQFMMYVSPILYTADSVLKGKPAWVQFVYGLNPMAGVAEGFRWALLGTPPPSAVVMASSVAAVTLMLVGGLFYFKRMERSFADVV